ncbi:T9SS C-terminal target domain-containing protein, partial [Candidatus Marinimicrobia bacterium PRS2]
VLSGCDNACNSTAVEDCAEVCDGTAVEDCAGECGGNAELDCFSICNGSSVDDICGTCDGNIVYPYNCDLVDSSGLNLNFEIFPNGVFSLLEWENGEVNLAELTIHNSGDTVINYYLYYYGYLNDEKAVDGLTKNVTIVPGDSTILSNTNFDPYSIAEYYQNWDFMYSLESLGHLYSGNYIVGIAAYDPDTEDLLANTFIGHSLGCTDPEATNYDEGSTMDDGSCYSGPDILSIYDVPQDQGGYVFINWSANSLDSPSNPAGMGNILKYSVWRYIPTNRGWEFLDYIDAYFFDEYAYTAPTIETSTLSDTLMTTYKVLAHTEAQEIFYASDPDSGYSIDNISPSVPDSVYAFSGYSNGITVNLSWAEPIDEDFLYFSLFRDGELINYIIENTYSDSPDSQINEVAYHITATDIHGNESEPSESITVQLSVNQTVQTGVGWNWFSINVVANDMSVNNVLNSLDATAGDFIKTQAASAEYYDEVGWFGSLSIINPADMYQLDIANGGEIAFTGYPVDPSSAIIHLTDGWNWIGYIPQHAGIINDALVSIGDSGIFIKNQAASAEYYDEFGWFGSLYFMSGGDGYQLKISGEADLIYPDFESDDDLTRSMEVKEMPEAISEWSVNPHAYEFNGAITLSVENREDSPGDYIAAFVDDECRGIAEHMDFPFDNVDRGIYILMAYSNMDKEEEITFKYFSLADDEVIDYTEQLNFTLDMVVGDGFNTFGLSKEYIIPDEFSLSAAYPNPFNPTTTLSFALPVTSNVILEVYDINGRLINELIKGIMDAGYHSVVWDANSYGSGVYFVKMVAGEYINTQKLMLIK